MSYTNTNLDFNDALMCTAGRVVKGLVQHPDGVHIIYPLGTTVVVKNTVENTQIFLQGHTESIECLAVSPDGTMVASGQSASVGFRVSRHRILKDV